MFDAQHHAQRTTCACAGDAETQRSTYYHISHHTQLTTQNTQDTGHELPHPSHHLYTFLPYPLIKAYHNTAQLYQPRGPCPTCKDDLKTRWQYLYGYPWGDDHTCMSLSPLSSPSPLPSPLSPPPSSLLPPPSSLLPLSSFYFFSCCFYLLFFTVANTFKSKHAKLFAKLMLNKY